MIRIITFSGYKDDTAPLSKTWSILPIDETNNEAVVVLYILILYLLN